jgi:methionine synthase I (cobalamin-dependent)
MHLDSHSDRPAVVDGAMGTELIARGLDTKTSAAEVWNLEAPDRVVEIHKAYLEAGAEAVHTNTFGALRSRLQRVGLAEKVTQVIATASQLARQAGAKTVFASLGPATGVSDINAEYAEAARACLAAEVDGIQLETQYDPADLVAAARGIRSAAPNLPLFVSLAVQPGSSGLESPSGVPLARLLRALREVSFDAVGANCAVDAERIRAVIEALAASVDTPVWARPQAKVSQKCATGTGSESAEAFARRAAALYRAGATVIGGCCGVGPAAIAALRRAVDDGAHRGPPSELEVA